MIDYKEIKESCDILEINEDASINDIKASFRRLSFEYHPDKNNNVINDKFLNLKSAYDILISFCENYKIDFSEKKLKEKEYDHIKQFYDGWLGDID
jgi:DnaJ-class molecular chaperone